MKNMDSIQPTKPITWTRQEKDSSLQGIDF
jgi:hypothetical protein